MRRHIYGGEKMNDQSIMFRCFNSDDLPEILRIQKANLVFNMPEDDKVNGFLSVEFPP